MAVGVEVTSARGDVRCRAAAGLPQRGHIATGIPFFDHMIDQIVAHGQINIDAQVVQEDEHCVLLMLALEGMFAMIISSVRVNESGTKMTHYIFCAWSVLYVQFALPRAL
eukprot:6185302-Pleurochrysis_carterae.AAC.1